MKQHTNTTMNNTGTLTYSKCSGENSVGFSGNSQQQRNNNIAESNANNITSKNFSGCSIGVMNNNTNNSEIPSSFPSHANPEAVGVTYCNDSGSVGFHNSFDSEPHKALADDKYISGISKSNILRHENSHYLSHRQHQNDHFLHHRSASGPRLAEQFINGHKERRDDDNELMHKLNQRVIIL